MASVLRSKAFVGCVLLREGTARAACLRVLMALVLLSSSSCTAPSRQLDAIARRSGFESLTLNGGSYALAAFFKPASSSSRALHVYLEGDGRPWAAPHRVASDPTPRNPVMLNLMRLDASPSLYLMRPCYGGRHRDAACSAELWTDRRYGPEVVDSMATALERFLAAGHYRSVTLMGHSGGGALAILLAARTASASAVVTLAGNLDTDAWTSLHGYSPLGGSLNPRAVAVQHWREWHWFGAVDAVVPPALMAPVAAERGAVEIVPGFDHRCCWDQVWPGILEDLKRRFADP